MRARSKSDSHIKHCEAELLVSKARKEESSIIQQLQIIGEQERIKNRSVIKALLLCTHFIAQQYIPCTNDFDKLVDLVMPCGGEDLKLFADRGGIYATYTSMDAIFDFIEAIGTWVDEFQLKLVPKARYFSWQINALILRLLKSSRCYGEHVELFFNVTFEESRWSINLFISN